MSWELLGDDQLIKRTEKSDFVNNGLELTEEGAAFFKAQGETKRLPLIFEGREYPGYLETEAGFTKLKWSKVLVRKLSEAFPDYEGFFKEEENNLKAPRIIFKKSENDYHVSFALDNQDRKTEVSMPQKKEAQALELRSLFYQWITGYQNYYPRDFRFSFKEIIQEDIPKALENNLSQENNYHIRGFAGETQWTEIPWVAVMDKSLTQSIKEELSLIYLLSMENKKLYLSLVYSDPQMGVRSLVEKVKEIQKTVDIKGYKTDHQNIFLANASLVSGTLCYQEYNEDLPEESVLKAEFQDFLEIYQDYVQGLSKTALQHDDEENLEEEMAEVFSEEIPEPLVVSQLFEEAEIKASENLKEEAQEKEAETGLGQAAFKEAPEEIKEEEEFLKNEEEILSETPSVFEKTKQESNEIKIQPMKKTRQRLDLSQWKTYPSENNKLTEDLEGVLGKMALQGFYYPAELVKNYYLALKTKPFVMLTGSLGSGKTSFPRIFAQAIGATLENGRFQSVLVRKEWEDSSKLLGHLDSRGHFVPGLLMFLLKNCKENPEKPHFLVLDEMNQSRAEDYFREILEGINGSSLPLLTRDYFGSDSGGFRDYGTLVFPDNLYLIGSVAEGEKKLPAKIIDSGNSIEMPTVEIGFFPNYENKTVKNSWENDYFKAQKKAAGLSKIVEKLMLALKEIQAILVKYSQPMGYRGLNEILAYGINSGGEDLFTVEEIIDFSLLQRVIPLLDEKKPRYEALLKALLFFCMGKTPKDPSKEDLFSGFNDLLDAGVIPQKHTARAILKKL